MIVRYLLFINLLCLCALLVGVVLIDGVGVMFLIVIVFVVSYLGMIAWVGWLVRLCCAVWCFALRAVLRWLAVYF